MEQFLNKCKHGIFGTIVGIVGTTIFTFAPDWLDKIYDEKVKVYQVEASTIHNKEDIGRIGGKVDQVESKVQKLNDSLIAWKNQTNRKLDRIGDILETGKNHTIQPDFRKNPDLRLGMAE